MRGLVSNGESSLTSEKEFLFETAFCFLSVELPDALISFP